MLLSWSALILVALCVVALTVVVGAWLTMHGGRASEMPTACRVCGGGLVLLEGEELMAALSPAARVEQRLGNVLHDAYRCASCAHIQHWSRVLRGARKCDICQTNTVRLEADSADPHGYFDDLLQLTYTCELCGTQRVTDHRVSQAGTDRSQPRQYVPADAGGAEGSIFGAWGGGEGDSGCGDGGNSAGGDGGCDGGGGD